MKITPSIAAAIRRAIDYYGNPSQLANRIGVAHSTVFFWISGKTSSISGKLWQSKIRPVLAPFMDQAHGNAGVMPEEMGDVLAGRPSPDGPPVMLTPHQYPKSSPVYLKERCRTSYILGSDDGGVPESGRMEASAVPFSSLKQ